MTVQDLHMDRAGSAPRRDAAGRVIEWEFQMPRVPEVKAPSVDLEPARHAAEQVLLVGIGAAVLLGRGVSRAVRTAVHAGEEVAERPDSVAHTLVGLVRPRAPKETRAAARPEARMKVPVLPIEGYDALGVDDAIARLEALSAEELRTVREYEAAHAARPALLDAIDARLNA